MVGRDRACYSITTIGKHKRSDDVGRDMQSLPFDSTHGGMTSARYGINALGQHIQLENISTYGQKWNTIISIGQFTESDHVRRDIFSLGQHTWWDDIKSLMPSSPLDSIHRDGQCRAWLVITALGKHTLSDEVESEILSLPLDCIHAQPTLGSTRGRKK
uniref:Uncharacterized protein n=1 Tax=Solanum lycopersicum TaxID=4081 RepID=A0A494G8I8_SOLLC